MIEREGPTSIRVGTASEQKFAKFLLSQAMTIPEAMVRLMAGPPTTARERFHRKAAEACLGPIGRRFVSEESIRS